MEYSRPGYMAHIIHDREIWGICKGYVGYGMLDCAPGMGACSIRTCQFSHLLEVGCTTLIGALLQMLKFNGEGLKTGI